MKRIAIFCDGTWNRSDARFLTNVAKLALAVRRTGEDGTVQQVFYLPGVGSGQGSNAVAKAVDRVGGGAFGWGLVENIVDAYRHIAFNYEVGDEIFIFGFSRGAYTARSLAGLIRSCGIPVRGSIQRIPEAIARYRNSDPETHPRTESSMRFRSSFAPLVATDPGEPEWRQAHGFGSCHPLEIAYLGVWDTVGALGVPSHYGMLAQVFNRRHQFHDAALSRMVRSARHAVAIDERRRTFPPTMWDNVDALNSGAGEGKRPYRQEWFPGDHGSVGGGGDVVGLSNLSLIWIAEGAQEAGLDLDREAMQAVAENGDPAVGLRSKSAPPTGVERLMRRAQVDREGPTEIANVSDVARRRWRLSLTPPYRPAPLARLAKELDAT